MSPSQTLTVPLQLGGGIIPRGTRVNVFQEIYWAFLILGTLVGIVVISYMLWNAYKYRDPGDGEDDDAERPQLGEIPTGGGKGRKLFLSFALSAIIVISLIVWTYGTLLYVENKATGNVADDAAQDPIEIKVVGYQFGWRFVYPNGHTVDGTMRVPEDRTIRLRVTSADVWHNFGIPALKVKSDAMPGQTTSTWFIAKETGTYTAHCYELCGAGHSYMDARVVVMKPTEYRNWYSGLNATNSSAS